MAVKIQVEVFWVVTPCSVAVGYQHHVILKMEATRSSETLVSYRNTVTIQKTLTRTLSQISRMT
jgi:hypothetical protein